MPPTPDLTHAQWTKSSHSNNGDGGCVEWAPTYAPSGTIPVRDSKDPEGPALLFTPDAWHSFVTALRTNEFPTP